MRMMRMVINFSSKPSLEMTQFECEHVLTSVSQLQAKLITSGARFFSKPQPCGSCDLGVLQSSSVDIAFSMMDRVIAGYLTASILALIGWVSPPSSRLLYLSRP